jgi:phosphoribosyl 1,2-cyclic phosphodiesterase
MPLRFTVLASGSAGNASLLQIDGFGLLVDAGLGPRILAARLAAAGASWSQIRAVLLTHTHSDHWREKTLVQLLRRRIPLYCHADHHRVLTTYGAAFGALAAEKLVRSYDAEQEFSLAPALRCRPLPLRHDGGSTFGFRFETSGDLFDQSVAVGYVADLGSWDDQLAQALANVDLLALEFNHDVDLEHSSGRSPYLIARILSEDGHLSNLQAVELLREIVRLSAPGRLRQVVQLHLSRDCNRPALAAETARAALVDAAAAVQLYTASQDEPGPTLLVDAPANNGHSGMPHSFATGRRPVRLYEPPLNGKGVRGRSHR